MNSHEWEPKRKQTTGTGHRREEIYKLSGIRCQGRAERRSRATDLNMKSSRVSEVRRPEFLNHLWLYTHHISTGFEFFSSPMNYDFFFSCFIVLVVASICSPRWIHRTCTGVFHLILNFVDLICLIVIYNCRRGSCQAKQSLKLYW